METKINKIVSKQRQVKMDEQRGEEYISGLIVQTAIKLLREEGLRFSVDDLASSLRISKKTIYKYFSSKESLAAKMFERIYVDVSFSADELTNKKGAAKSDVAEMLKLLSNYFYFADESIYNRYSLNESSRQYFCNKSDELITMLEKLLVACGYEKVAKNASFRTVTVAALKLFAQSERSNELIEAYTELLLGDKNA